MNQKWKKSYFLLFLMKMCAPAQRIVGFWNPTLLGDSYIHLTYHKPPRTPKCLNSTSYEEHGASINDVRIWGRGSQKFARYQQGKVHIIHLKGEECSKIHQIFEYNLWMILTDTSWEPVGFSHCTKLSCNCNPAFQNWCGTCSKMECFYRWLVLIKKIPKHLILICCCFS